MRKFNAILLGILAIQIVLAVVMYARPGTVAVGSQQSWVQIDPTKLKAITIADANGQAVTLRHADDGWQLPERHNFPANAKQIKHLATRLDSVQTSLPVSQSASAQQRFHVSKKAFEKHVVFKTEKGTAADIYLGKSAGANRLYARLADSDDIQSIRLPSWRVSADAANWLDKTWLAPALKQQKKIMLPHVTLVRKGDAWTIKDLADGRAADSGHVQALLTRLRGLQFDTLVGTKKTVDLPGQATFSMVLTSKKEQKTTWNFYKQPATSNTGSASSDTDKQKAESKPDWRVTRSDGHFVLTIKNALVEDLLKASDESLSTAAGSIEKDQ